MGWFGSSEKKSSESRLWGLVGTGAATLAAVLARRTVERGWRRFSGEGPPKNPRARTTSWREALVWAGVAALASAIARLVARRGAAGLWSRVSGDDPPVDA